MKSEITIATAEICISNELNNCGRRLRFFFFTLLTHFPQCLFFLCGLSIFDSYIKTNQMSGYLFISALPHTMNAQRVVSKQVR